MKPGWSQQLRFKSNNLESYNDLFSVQELMDAISKSRNMAVDPDDIHYDIFKHLHREGLNTPLEALNNIWLPGKLPDSWRTSTVIPLPKLDKDKSDPSSYCIIALTSCICKS